MQLDRGRGEFPSTVSISWDRYCQFTSGYSKGWSITSVNLDSCNSSIFSDILQNQNIMVVSLFMHKKNAGYTTDRGHYLNQT